MYSVIQDPHLRLGYFIVCYPHNLNINTIDEETVITHSIWSTELLPQDEESLKQSSSAYRIWTKPWNTAHWITTGDPAPPHEGVTRF